MGIFQGKKNAIVMFEAITNFSNLFPKLKILMLGTKKTLSRYFWLEFRKTIFIFEINALEFM